MLFEISISCFKVSDLLTGDVFASDSGLGAAAAETPGPPDPRAPSAASCRLSEAGM